MLVLLRAAVLADAHDRCLADRNWPHLAVPVPPRDVWGWIETNHLCNALLWHEEDEARRTDVPDAAVAANKRRIDRYNQERNDAVEAIDLAILGMIGVRPDADARLSSETAGAMIDRLSILALKIHHMRLQAGRNDAGPAHVAACAEKLERLTAQREDLAACLDRLLEEAREGRAYFKLWRQYRTHNGSALYPSLYGGGASGVGAGTGVHGFRKHESK
ncbi:MAG: DUF4254 domain-containing protein [Ignavibacteria bacterium]